MRAPPRSRGLASTSWMEGANRAGHEGRGRAGEAAPRAGGSDTERHCARLLAPAHVAPRSSSLTPARPLPPCLLGSAPTAGCCMQAGWRRRRQRRLLSTTSDHIWFETGRGREAGRGAAASGRLPGSGSTQLAAGASPGGRCARRLSETLRRRAGAATARLPAFPRPRRPASLSPPGCCVGSLTIWFRRPLRLRPADARAPGAGLARTRKTHAPPAAAAAGTRARAQRPQVADPHASIMALLRAAGRPHVAVQRGGLRPVARPARLSRPQGAYMRSR